MAEYVMEEPSDRSSSWRVHERIVRCRDCRYYTDDEMEYYHYCGFWCGQVEPNGFCAWGERKEVNS